MSSEKKPRFAENPEVETFRYRGPDRRDKETEEKLDDVLSRQIRFDAKGNPVLDVRTNVPRRREEDDTIDLLKCLDNSQLSIEDD
jgi:chorismate-pyruvate lyase